MEANTASTQCDKGETLWKLAYKRLEERNVELVTCFELIVVHENRRKRDLSNFRRRRQERAC
jgi:hypothetical protein